VTSACPGGLSQRNQRLKPSAPRSTEQLETIHARIADLPIDAPLPDVLALLVKFRTEELSDSGCWRRSLLLKRASALIDRARKALTPLEIKREELSQFISEQVKKRTQRDQ